MCKLSGMVPETEDKPWEAGEIQPYAEHVIQAFGHKRIMFGSDWPVCLLSATYEQVWELLESISWKFTEAEKQAVYGSNAIEFYKLQDNL
jgi:L-fuconolactonase